MMNLTSVTSLARWLPFGNSVWTDGTLALALRGLALSSGYFVIIYLGYFLFDFGGQMREIFLSMCDYKVDVVKVVGQFDFISVRSDRSIELSYTVAIIATGWFIRFVLKKISQRLNSQLPTNQSNKEACVAISQLFAILMLANIWFSMYKGLVSDPLGSMAISYWIAFGGFSIIVALILEVFAQIAMPQLASKISKMITPASFQTQYGNSTNYSAHSENKKMPEWRWRYWAWLLNVGWIYSIGAVFTLVIFITLTIGFLRMDERLIKFTLTCPMGVAVFGLTLLAGILAALHRIDESGAGLKVRTITGIRAQYFVVVAFLIAGAIGRNLQPGNSRMIADVRDPKREYKLESVDERLTAWKADDKKVNEERIKKNQDLQTNRMILFVADGGGIHAAYRAATALAAMDDKDEDATNRIFATSTVSGGSIGTAVYFAIKYAVDQKIKRDEAERASQEEKESSQSQSVDSSKDEETIDEDSIPRSDMVRGELASFFGGDLLSPVLGKLIFAEWVGLFARDNPDVDRGKALEKSVMMGIGRISPELRKDAEAYLNSGLLTGEIYHSQRVNFGFNTAITSSGDCLLLSRLKLRRVKSLANLIEPQDISILSAACASARFPGITGPAGIRVGHAQNRDRDLFLVDGGLYDNSGINTIIEVLREIRRASNLAESAQQVAVCLVGNNFTPSLDDVGTSGGDGRSLEDVSSFGPAVREKGVLKNDVSLLMESAVKNLLTRNSEPSRRAKAACTELEAVPFVFPWCGDVIGAPLGWYLHPSRTYAIDWNLGLYESFDPSKARRLIVGYAAPHGFVAKKDCEECTYLGSSPVQMNEHFKRMPESQMLTVRNFNKKQVALLIKFLGASTKDWTEPELKARLQLERKIALGYAKPPPADNGKGDSPIKPETKKE